MISDTTMLLILVSIFIFMIILIFNSLTSKRNNVKNSLATVDVQLKKRFDLIPNLVSLTKEFMAHESKLLEQLTLLRSQPSNTVSSESNKTFQQFLVTAENYPDLKSHQNFLEVQKSLTEVEHQIAASRRSYNAMVNDYNTTIQIFPHLIFAKILNFTSMDLFQISENERQNINIQEMFKK